MNVHELLEKVYEVKTTYEINPEVDEVGVAKVRFLPYNPRRLSFVVCNLSANNIFIAPESTVSVTRGILLVPNGGTLSMVWTEDFELSCLEWYAIASGANSAIFVLETLIQ